MQQVLASQASPEVPINENFQTLEALAVYAKRQPATSGLVWGYYGGQWGGFTVAEGAQTLGASSTTYMVVNRTTGAASFATATTNWDDATTFGRAFKLVTGGSTVTSYEDHRFAASGIFGGGGGGTALDIDTLPAASALAGADLYAVSQGGTESKATHTQLMTAILLLLGDSDGTLAANSATKIAVQSAVKTYVDAKLAGLSWKQAVRAATTANGTLASAFANTSVIDGVTLATGDRILLKDQSTGADNGIYTVNASGAPTRATDADSGAELVDATVAVAEGTANADTIWTCTTNAPITPGSTSLTWTTLPIFIANNAVTYAKIQDITATQRLLGRNTAGSGDPEEVTLTQLLDWIGSAAQGDILYRGSSAWARLAAGTAGFHLKTGGAGASPSWVAPPVCLAIAASDETTAITSGTAKATFINPFSTAFNVTSVVASLTTAQTSGSIFTVDINEAGTSIISTKLTIDNTEKNSSTAATAAVISDASIAAYAEISVDVDQVGDGTAKGLKVYLIGYPS